MTCYSTVDNGYGYRGLRTEDDCALWTKFPVSQNTTAGLGNHKFCRNPDPQARSEPWCYESDGDIEDCSVSKCINGIISRNFNVRFSDDVYFADGLPSVTFVCGGDSGKGDTECIFPFIYKGKRFFECTTFEKSVPWCSTKNEDDGNMKKWSYCLCPSEKQSRILDRRYYIACFI